MIGWILENIAKARANKASELSRRERHIEERTASLERLDSRISTVRAEVEELSQEKALGFPWLATAYAEYFRLLDDQLADLLEQKKHPAMKAADALRATAAEKAALRRENKILRELHRYYEGLFPGLSISRARNLMNLFGKRLGKLAEITSDMSGTSMNVKDSTSSIMGSPMAMKISDVI